MITRRRLLSLLFPPIWFPVLFGPVEPVQPPTVQEWEYRLEVIQDRRGWPVVLEKRGIEGWELCSRTDRPGVIEFIWKRPKA